MSVETRLRRLERKDRLERRSGLARLSEHDLMLQGLTDEELSDFIAMCKARLIELGHDPEALKRAEHVVERR